MFYENIFFYPISDRQLHKSKRHYLTLLLKLQKKTYLTVDKLYEHCVGSPIVFSTPSVFEKPDDSFVCPSLPFTNIEDLEIFNHQLSCSKYSKQMVCVSSSKKGTTYILNSRFFFVSYSV
jgi:hypothetical protein